MNLRAVCVALLLSASMAAASDEPGDKGDGDNGSTPAGGAGSGVTFVMPSTLTPTGVASKLLGDNASTIAELAGLAFVLLLAVAARAIVMRRFASSQGLSVSELKSEMKRDVEEARARRAERRRRG